MIPTTGETEANVWYRVDPTVRVATGGLTHTSQRDMNPRKVVKLTLATNPSGLGCALDGQPVATPLAFDGVVGIAANLLSAATPPAVRRDHLRVRLLVGRRGGSAWHLARRRQDHLYARRTA